MRFLGEFAIRRDVGRWCGRIKRSGVGVSCAHEIPPGGRVDRRGGMSHENLRADEHL